MENRRAVCVCVVHTPSLCGARGASIEQQPTKRFLDGGRAAAPEKGVQADGWPKDQTLTLRSHYITVSIRLAAKHPGR